MANADDNLKQAAKGTLVYDGRIFDSNRADREKKGKLLNHTSKYEFITTSYPKLLIPTPPPKKGV